MITSNISTTQSLMPRARSRLYWTLADALVLAKRHLVQIPRIPEELVFSTIQPIMFVLLFRYVFGGAIAVRGTSYVNYLMAGIFVQTVVFGSTSTGIGLATDLQRGLVDRFRSLPMAKSAVLTGRTISDLVRNTFVVAVMWTVGLLVGFRPQGGVLSWMAAIGILLLTSFAFSWISASSSAVIGSGGRSQWDRSASERIVPACLGGPWSARVARCSGGEGFGKGSGSGCMESVSGSGFAKGFPLPFGEPFRKPSMKDRRKASPKPSMKAFRKASASRNSSHSGSSEAIRPHDFATLGLVGRS